MPEFLKNINFVSAILIFAFLLPVAAGALSAFSRNRVRQSLASLLESAEFILGLVFSIYLTNRIFFEHDGSFFSRIYDILPQKIKAIAFGQDMMVYIIAVPVVLFIMLLVIRLATGPLYEYVLFPIADAIYRGVNSMAPIFRKITGALWQLPKALVTTIVLALVLNFAMYYVYSPSLAEWLSNSKEYQLIYNNVLYPVLNSNVAKKIPVIMGDSFRKASGGAVSGKDIEHVGNSIKNLSGGNIKIIEYFNGVTLDEAVKSDEEIDKTAASIVGNEKNEKKKAYLIYKWISKNVVYDSDKAEKIISHPEGLKSGSIVAFNTRKGICFDYSCLYITMCHATGLKVRLITGQGYSGVAWGDHAWNQVWSGSEKRWISLDTTFGSTGVNYFDKPDFSVDHKYAEIQGEW
jgi:hypothetical protein